MTKSRTGSEADAARKDIKGNEVCERSTLKLKWRWRRRSWREKRGHEGVEYEQEKGFETHSLGCL